MKAFTALLAGVYADPRGWSLGGAVEFRQAPTGGSFTIWLAAPDAMKSFGDDCSAMWSCRAGRDIAINEARWKSGSPYWHGPIAIYRAMLINHETGHWIGLDHRACPGRGALAPIMMQQSKGTGECIPNAWPLPSERHEGARLLGLF